MTQSDAAPTESGTPRPGPVPASRAAHAHADRPADLRARRRPVLRMTLSQAVEAFRLRQGLT